MTLMAINPSSYADLTDLGFFLEPLNSALFPRLPSGIKVHNGFADEHAKYAI